MTDIQLERSPTGRLKYLSHWAPQEPAIQTRKLGNSDHWTKMKHKNVNFVYTEKDGTVRTFHGDRARHEKIDEGTQRKLLQFRHDIDGTLGRVGDKSFNDLIVAELHGHLPGDYLKARPYPHKLLRTTANVRAREGFEYWPLDKKPFKAASYTSGSKGTFLGIGKRHFP